MSYQNLTDEGVYVVKNLFGPTQSDVHVNTPLTNFSQKYLLNQNMFIATRAMPNIQVTKQSDLYYEFNRGDFYRDEAKERAEGSESAGGGWRLSQEPYFAKVYAFHTQITDRAESNQDAAVQLDRSSTEFVTHKLLIRRELLFLDQYFNTGLWTTNNTTARNWDAAGDPIQDIRSARTTVQALTGYRPNKMILPRPVYDALLDNAEILARITGGATSIQPAMVMKQLLEVLFEMDEIFIIDMVYNTAPQDANPDSASFELVANNGALLYYAPDSVGLNEPTAGVQFSWTGRFGSADNGQRIKRFYIDQLESTRVEGQMAFDYKLSGADLGYFFSNVITP